MMTMTSPGVAATGGSGRRSGSWGWSGASTQTTSWTRSRMHGSPTTSASTHTRSPSGSRIAARGGRRSRSSVTSPPFAPATTPSALSATPSTATRTRSSTRQEDVDQAGGPPLPSLASPATTPSWLRLRSLPSLAHCRR